MFGEANARAVAFFHGGGQTRHAWRATAEAVAAAGWCAWTIDLRGHGESDRASGGVYDLHDFTADVAATIAALPERPIVVGASLGGGAALVCCAERELAVGGLVLVDIGVRARPEGVERIVGFMRRHADGFASLEDAAVAVAAYAPREGRAIRPEGLQKNLRRDAEGRYRWHWDPALLDAFDVDQVTRSGRLEVALRAIAAKAIPFAVVHGGRSDVLDAATAQRTAELAGGTVLSVGDAAHMVAGEANDAFTAALLTFLTA